MVALLDRRIADDALRSMYVKVGPAEYCSTARIVMHRSNDAFARVREAGDAARFFDGLLAEWPKLREAMLADSFIAETTPQPTVRINVKVRLDDVYRAVAKTAFNVLAMHVGVTFALSSEFDELREYVLGRDVRHPEHLGTEEIAVDHRFVREVPFGERPLVPTDEHVVTLFYDRGQMLAYLTLYKVHSFVVILGTISLPEPVLATHEFSMVRRGNTALEIEEVYNRLVRRGGAT